MPVNWLWKDKVGEFVYKNNKTKKSFGVSVYLANCLCCLIYEKKGSEEYQFVTFFSDRKHLERCLGLRKSFDGSKDDIIEKMYIDCSFKKLVVTRYTDETKTIMDCFIKSGKEVQFKAKKERKNG